MFPKQECLVCKQVNQPGRPLCPCSSNCPKFHKILQSYDLFASPDVLTNVAETLNNTGAYLLYCDMYYVRLNQPEHVVRYWEAGELHHSIN